MQQISKKVHIKQIINISLKATFFQLLFSYSIRYFLTKYYFLGQVGSYVKKNTFEDKDYIIFLSIFYLLDFILLLFIQIFLLFYFKKTNRPISYAIYAELIVILSIVLINFIIDF